MQDARLEVFGQDHNPGSYAVCGSDLLIKGHGIEHIAFGSSFSKDGFPRQKFDYMLANPPFGVEWKPDEDEIRKEADTLGFDGRFGAGLPRINDGSFLFLQHMISKMRPVDKGGTRLAIVFNGSPLFTGEGAGAGCGRLPDAACQGCRRGADRVFSSTTTCRMDMIAACPPEAGNKRRPT